MCKFKPMLQLNSQLSEEAEEGDITIKLNTFSAYQMQSALRVIPLIIIILVNQMETQ